MKKLLFIISIALASCEKSIETNNVIYTEDMPTLVKSSNDIKIVVSDSVEGRQTYNVLFPDGTMLESMYPEEIANGLVTDSWSYNEDLTISK
jgi:hypothetical protein